jgi:hypothetical protein
MRGVLFCHSDQSEESLILLEAKSETSSEMFRFAQHDNDGMSPPGFEAWSLKFPWCLGFGIWCFNIQSWLK